MFLFASGSFPEVRFACVIPAEGGIRGEFPDARFHGHDISACPGYFCSLLLEHRERILPAIRLSSVQAGGSSVRGCPSRSSTLLSLGEGSVCPTAGICDQHRHWGSGNTKPQSSCIFVLLEWIVNTVHFNSIQRGRYTGSRPNEVQSVRTTKHELRWVTCSTERMHRPSVGFCM